MRNLLIILLASSIFTSCIGGFGERVDGNGNIKSEHRNLQNFTGVTTAGSIDVEISSGDKFEVLVEDDENLLRYIVTSVEGNNLVIKYKDDIWVNNDHAKVYVTAPTLTKITSSGSANVTFDEGITSDKALTVGVSGSGNAEGGLDAPEVTATVSGSGNIKLHGRTRDLEVRTTGSGDIDCAELKAENVKARATGSGNIHVFASMTLEANTTGSGDITYGGSPSSPKIHTTGSGSVSPE